MANLSEGLVEHLWCQAKQDSEFPGSLRESDGSTYPGINARAVRNRAAPPSSHPVNDTEDMAPANKRQRSPKQLIANANRTNVPTKKETLVRPFHKRGKGRPWKEANPRPTTPRGVRQRPTDTQRPSEFGDRQKAGGEVEVTIMQPVTRPMSHEQLVAEVKGIFAGLVGAESKCIEVDSSQNAHAKTDTEPNEQWQLLISPHQTFLHEHHDFFSASQNTSAISAVRSFALKYAMPARMLRHRLPASLGHMLTVIYLTYSIVAATVLNFKLIWIECWNNLGGYSIPTKNNDNRDEEIWSEVSRYWYSKASDKVPTTGRLHHHLAIPAPPNATKQLFYYTKSLCISILFKSARDSILTLFEPRLPEGCTLSGMLGAGTLCRDDWFRSGTFDNDERRFGLPLLMEGIYERVSWCGWVGGHFRTPRFHSDLFDDVQSKHHSDGLAIPRYPPNSSYLLSTIPRKFLGLAILTAMAIPVVSAELPRRDVVTMAWAFGIMANVPSGYVLANPPVPPRAGNGVEEIVWKIARGWGMTFGPVFAAVFVVLLRAKLPREKRLAFIALVFVMSVVLMLLLKLFMRGDTFSVLDLLALCVSFCAGAAKIITSEPRGMSGVNGDLGLEGGRPQFPQGDLAGNQPVQPTRVIHEDGGGDDLAAVQSSTRSDDPFIIGEDSTLGDGESRT